MITDLKLIIYKSLQYEGEERINYLLNAYRTYRPFIKIREEYQKNNYLESLNQLKRIIEENKKILFLDITFTSYNFVNIFLNDYYDDNHGVIRNSKQLSTVAKKLTTRKKTKESNLIQKLSQKAAKAAVSLLIVDKSCNIRNVFITVLHEFNAWLSSGCGGGGLYSYGMMNDWRSNIPQNNIHRKLDYYVIGKDK